MSHPRRPRTRYLPAAALLLIVGTTAGCAGADGSSAGDSEPAIELQPITSSSQLVMPVASYVLTAADEKAYFSAVNLVQRQCAQEFGVDTSMPAASQPTQMQLITPRRVGVVDAGDVAKYGYTMPPSAGLANYDTEAEWDPDAREQMIMDGVDASGNPVTKDPETGKELPEGGCALEGFRSLDQGQTSPARNDLVTQILNDSWAFDLKDSRVVEADKKWAACMSKHGFDFKQRGDAGNSTAGKSDKYQVHMAVLDLGCAVDTDYNAVVYAVDRAYQERLIDEHEGELQASLADQREVMERVHDVLQGGE
jgi:hypothetical protein